VYQTETEILDPASSFICHVGKIRKITLLFLLCFP